MLAGDEASLYLQASVRRVWHACGQTPVVNCAPNRDSTHFFGALNLLNGKVSSMRSPVMNSATSALFLQQRLAAYPDRPLLLCWDRAPGHPLGSAAKASNALSRTSAVRNSLFSTGLPRFESTSAGLESHPPSA